MIVEVQSTEAPELAPYAALTEAQLRSRLNPEHALFIAESPKVISVALDAGYEPVSMLCERRHIEGDAAGIIGRCSEEMPVYTGSRETLASLTGYRLTRGVLCAMRRPEPPSPEEVVGHGGGRRRIAVIDSVTDTTNIGAIFRAAAALGVDGVVLTRRSCDPLNRRSIRVSMGSVFLIPWTWIDSPSELRQYGFKTAAMALTDRSISIADPILKAQERLAVIVGTEGDGLEPEVISEADFTVRIPMCHGVDSLNVAAAASIAFWELRI